MADILIRMEMPDSCSDCPMCYDMIECTVSPLQFWYGRPENEQFDFCNERHPDCPLVELPEHGDLIDKQAVFKALSEKFKSSDGFVSWTDAIDIVLRAQEIVPSNKEDAE